jgi:hypothetical protein
MSVFRVFRTPQWVLGRRVALVVVILILALRNYGDTLSSWFRSSPDGQDVVITQSEFRGDLRDGKPAWIIRLKNESRSATYNQFELEATYKDSNGKTLEVDKMVLRQKLAPGEEQVVASSDFKARPGATTGTLRVLSVSK